MVRIDHIGNKLIHELANLSQSHNLPNASCNGSSSSSNESCVDVAPELETEKVYWALVLIPLPLVAVVGNILVILSIYKEKSLQTVTNYFIVSLAFADLLVAAVVMPFAVYVLRSTGGWALVLIPLPLVAVVGILVILSIYEEKSLQTVTNYFIVSLAFADLLVAAVVMPFAVYVLVNVEWELSDTLCDFYIAVDVTCSTASIFNLVAISIDRYIAVTQPIKYSKHRNNKRVFLTIAIVWLVSAAIGSPIVLGLNTSPERIPQLCVFYNSDFIIYSSLSSFYIPCIVMVFLYYKIFKAIHERAKKNQKRAALGNRPPLGTIPGNKAMLLAQIAQDSSQQTLQVVVQTDAVTNMGSEQEPYEDLDEDYAEDARVLPNGDDHHPHNRVVMRLTTLSNSNSSKDESTSLEETQFAVTAKDSPNDSPQSGRLIRETPKKNGILKKSKKKQIPGVVVEKKKRSRFNLGKRHKSSSKKREKASAKRERKATKTLAIVLGMFLMCWVPFFTCNILDAICIKLETDTWRPGMTIFLITTWLGYINSCVNPVIYTIFNLEFRKAFKKLLQGMWTCSTVSSK